MNILFWSLLGAALFYLLLYAMLAMSYRQNLSA